MCPHAMTASKHLHSLPSPQGKLESKSVVSLCRHCLSLQTQALSGNETSPDARRVYRFQRGLTVSSVEVRRGPLWSTELHVETHKKHESKKKTISVVARAFGSEGSAAPLHAQTGQTQGRACVVHWVSGLDTGLNPFSLIAMLHIMISDTLRQTVRRFYSASSSATQL
jgi:hypothetical protein